MTKRQELLKNRLCEECGKLYDIKYDYGIKYLKKRKFCSISCLVKNKNHREKTFFKKGHPGSKASYKDGASSKLKKWREEIFKRDNWTCQKCGTKGKYLNAHHIKEQSLFPELKFNLLNGTTLCRPCHQELHKKKGWINQHNMQTIKDGLAVEILD